MDPWVRRALKITNQQHDMIETLRQLLIAVSLLLQAAQSNPTLTPEEFRATANFSTYAISVVTNALATLPSSTPVVIAPPVSSPTPVAPELPLFGQGEVNDPATSTVPVAPPTSTPPVVVPTTTQVHMNDIDLRFRYEFVVSDYSENTLLPNGETHYEMTGTKNILMRVYYEASGLDIKVSVNGIEKTATLSGRSLEWQNLPPGTYPLTITVTKGNQFGRITNTIDAR